MIGTAAFGDYAIFHLGFFSTRASPPLGLVGKTTTFSLSACVCMPTGDSDMVGTTLLFPVKAAFHRLTGYCSRLGRCSHLVAAASTASRCEASTAGLRWYMGIGSLHLNVSSSAAVILIIGTTHHITV